VLVYGEGKGCRAVDSRVILKKKKYLLEQSKIPARLFWQGFFVLARDHFGQSIFIPGGIYPCFSTA
jgi:hypothetical protein